MGRRHGQFNNARKLAPRTSDEPLVRLMDIFFPILRVLVGATSLGFPSERAPGMGGGWRRGGEVGGGVPGEPAESVVLGCRAGGTGGTCSAQSRGEAGSPHKWHFCKRFSDESHDVSANNIQNHRSRRQQNSQKSLVRVTRGQEIRVNFRHNRFFLNHHFQLQAPIFFRKDLLLST